MRWSATCAGSAQQGSPIDEAPSHQRNSPTQPTVKLILYTHVEVIHHGAEICQMRDLYLRKDNRDSPQRR